MNASSRRNDDDRTASHPRDERYFTLDNHWYFTTREGLVMGPFDSRAQAVGEAANYIRFTQAATARVLDLVRRDKVTIPIEPITESW